MGTQTKSASFVPVAIVGALFILAAYLYGIIPGRIKGSDEPRRRSDGNRSIQIMAVFDKTKPPRIVTIRYNLPGDAGFTSTTISPWSKRATARQGSIISISGSQTDRGRLSVQIYQDGRRVKQDSVSGPGSADAAWVVD